MNIVEQHLIDWIPTQQEGFARPNHCEELCGVLENAPRSGSRTLVAFPVRHYKTTCVMYGIAWALLRDPTLRISFMTHSAMYAQSRGREIRDICQRAGVSVQKGHSTIHEWRTEEGGGVLAMSAQQSALGQDIDVLVVDDPFESQSDADDPEVRHRVDYTIAFYTSRLQRGGSVILVMSPFHLDDAIGRRRRRMAQSWRYIHHQALIDEGLETERAFAPDVRTVEELKSIRAELREQDPSERTWYAQWQCEPRGESGDLFKTPARYGSLPSWHGYRDAIGIDAAYSTSRTADWFAIVCMRVWGSTAFIRHVERFRADHGMALARLRWARATFGGTVFSYMSGPEIGVASYFQSQNIPIQVMHARYNKRIRAQKTIDAWNASRVLVPESAAWLDDFLARTMAFRGVEGDDDDEQDAMVSAVDGALFSGTSVPKAVGLRRL